MNKFQKPKIRSVSKRCAKAAALFALAILACAPYAPAARAQPPASPSQLEPQPELVLQLGHTSGIGSVFFPPDETTLISVSTGVSTVQVWNARTGDLLRTWVGSVGDMTAVTLSPDGRILATAHGRHLFSARRPSEVRLWEAETGRLLRTFGKVGSDPYSVAFSPDGQFLSALGGEGLWVWHVSTGRLLWTLPLNPLRGYGGRDIRDSVFSPDSKSLAVATGASEELGGLDPTNQRANQLELRDTETGQLLHALDVGPQLVGKAFSPDGKTLAGASQVRKVESGKWVLEANLWDTDSGRLLNTLRWFGTENRESVGWIHFLPDGKSIARPTSGKMEIWDLQTGQLRTTLTRDDGKEIAGKFLFSTDGRQMIVWQDLSRKITPYRDIHEVQLWDVTLGRLMQTWMVPYGVDAPPALSSDGRRMAWSTYNGRLTVLDLQTGQWRSAPLEFPKHEQIAQVRAVAFAPSGESVACGLAQDVYPQDAEWGASGGSSASNRGEIALWDVQTGRIKRMFTPADQSVTSLAFSPDGRVLAGGIGADLHWRSAGAVAQWDVATGKLLLTTAKQPGIVTSLAYLPDGQTLATGSGQMLKRGQASVWDAKTGTLRRVITNKSNTVTSVALSKDGRTLVCGSHDGTVEVWDLPSGVRSDHITVEFSPGVREPNFWVKAVAITPDGSAVAAVDEYNVKIWNGATGELQQTLTGHLQRVLSVAFSPDGKTLATGSFDNTMRLWDVASGALLHTCIGHTDAVRSVIFSPNGRVVASASYDGMVKFWNAGSGELSATLLLLFRDHRDAARKLHRAAPDWLAYTPDGYYDGSLGGAKLIRWRVGDHLVALQTYEKRFHRPDKVRQGLRGE